MQTVQHKETKAPTGRILRQLHQSCTNVLDIHWHLAVHERSAYTKTQGSSAMFELALPTL